MRDTDTTKKNSLLLPIIVIVIIVALFLFFNQNNTQNNSLSNTTGIGSFVPDEPYNSHWAYPCPSLSNLKILDNLAPDDSTSLAWVAEQAPYSSDTESLTYTDFYFVDDTRPSIEIKKVILCNTGGIDLGNDENRIYCGSKGLPIILTKSLSDGKTAKTSIEVIFDAKTKLYLDTKCGTYELP